MTSLLRRRLLFAAWTAWVAVLLARYYVQIARSIVTQSWFLRSELFAAAVPILLILFLVVVLVFGSGYLPRVYASERAESSASTTLWQPPKGAGLLLAFASAATLPWLFSRQVLTSAASGLSVPGLRWLGEALARGGSAMAGAALIALAAMCAGAVVLRRLGWRATSRVEQIVFPAVTGVGVVSYACLALAVVGLYRPVVIALLIAVLIAAGIPLALRASADRRWFSIRRPANVTIAASVWTAIAAVAIGYALIAALAPEKEYDALWYHLQLPRVWLQAGHPVDIVEEYVSLYPLTWELVFGAGMVLGGPVAAKLLHFGCLPLLALLVREATRRFAPGASTAAAVAILITTPTLLWESGTAYVDLALALHSAAACYALARYGETREHGWRSAAALQFGFAAATKHLGVFVTIIALVLFAISAARSFQGGARALRAAALMAVIAAAVPFPWYLRAWLASGNPVFPEMFSVFGAAPPWRWDALAEQGLGRFKAHFGLGRSVHALLMLPWNVTVHGALFGGSLGPIFLLLVPVLLFTRRNPPAVRLLSAGIAAYVAMWASPISSFQMRFLMPIAAPMAVLAAVSLSATCGWASTVSRRARFIPTAWVMSLAVLNLPPFVRLHEADRVGWDGWLTHVLRDPPASVVAGRESESAYLGREVPSYNAWRTINARLPAGVRILTFSGGDQLYAERPRISHDAPAARAAVWGSAPDDITAAADALQKLGITHVLFDRRELPAAGTNSFAIATPAFQRACISEFDDRRYWLCRLDYALLVDSLVPRHHESSFR